MSNVLIIGLGSVGRRHFVASTKLGNRVVGVDPKSAKFLHEDLQGMELHRGLKTLKGRNFEYTVVANWGPDHVSTLREVYEMGLCSKFIIEKPLCGSFKELRDLRNLVSKGPLQFILSFPRRYSDFKRYVEEATDGVATSISVWGGAQCISTNGSHWLDAAVSIFGLPISVMASLNSQPINPRSPDLDFFEGTASYQFAGGKKLDISFDNKSRVSSTARVLFRDGVLEIRKGTEFWLEKVDPDAIEGTSLTRTQFPTKAQKFKNSASLDEAFLTMHERIAKESITRAEMHHDLELSGWLLMAFLSSSSGVTLRSEHFLRSTENSNHSWRIS